MSRKILALGLIVVLLGAGIWIVGAQEEEAHPIVTTASDVVGVGTYVGVLDGAADPSRGCVRGPRTGPRPRPGDPGPGAPPPRPRRGERALE